VTIEREVCAATSTSLVELQAVPAIEVLWHAASARQERAAEKMWDVQVAMWRWIPQGVRTQIHSSLARQMQSASGRDLSAFAQCQTDDERLRIIGCDVAVHGEQWLAGHPEQRSWLADNGYTPDDAVAADRAWTRQMYAQHDFRNRPDWMTDDGKSQDSEIQRVAE
jgi:hypothetical protein